MDVVTTNFNNTTLKDWLRGDKTHLNNNKRTTCKHGTITVLTNLDTQSVIGVCMLANWENTDSPCRERHPLDYDTYSGTNSKYNKYEINITNFRLLKFPMSFAKILALIGGDLIASKKTNNMFRGLSGKLYQGLRAAWF